MKPSLQLVLLSTLSLLSSPAHAWGRLGHRTVAYLAEKYFSNEGANYVDRLLGRDDISDASLWADEIRNRPEGRGTSGWHYIDAKDDPPAMCGVQFRRDCAPKAGCVVSAITNMTSRVNDAALSVKQQKDALRFLLHFIGDVHQPLHTEDESRGGNDIDVLFDGDRTNLHAVWDTSIPVKIVGGEADGAEDERRQARRWADALYARGRAARSRGSCTNVATAEDCALVWAGDANRYVCSYVLRDDVQGVEGKELGGGYYAGAVPIVEELIAKAGYRLGEWINGLALEESRNAGGLG